jgi:hypothetical protein
MIPFITHTISGMVDKDGYFIDSTCITVYMNICLKLHCKIQNVHCMGNSGCSMEYKMYMGSIVGYIRADHEIQTVGFTVVYSRAHCGI